MTAALDDTLLPAWDDAVHASQATFRCVLDALAQPGTVQTLRVEVRGPEPLGHALTAMCLALADADTPIWCDGPADNDAVSAYLRFHCGSPMTGEPGVAVFAIVTRSEDLDLGVFAQGSMEYPDRSATLLVQVPSLSDGPLRTLSGPGIPYTEGLRVAGLPATFDAQWRANASAFPLGVDIVFCSGSQIVGLPRTTRIHSD